MECHKIWDQNVLGPRSNVSHIKKIESKIVLIKDYFEYENWGVGNFFGSNEMSIKNFFVQNNIWYQNQKNCGQTCNISRFQTELKLPIWQQQRLQAKSEQNFDMADIIIKTDPNVSGYTSVSILRH